MWRTDSLEKPLMLGKIEGMRRRELQRMRWLDNITDSLDLSFNEVSKSEGQRSLVLLQFVGSQSQRGFSDWTAATWDYMPFLSKGVWFNFFLSVYLFIEYRQTLCPWSGPHSLLIIVFIISLLFLVFPLVCNQWIQSLTTTYLSLITMLHVAIYENNVTRIMRQSNIQNGSEDQINNHK